MRSRRGRDPNRRSGVTVGPARRWSTRPAFVVGRVSPRRRHGPALRGKRVHVDPRARSTQLITGPKQTSAARSAHACFVADAVVSAGAPHRRKRWCDPPARPPCSSGRSSLKERLIGSLPVGECNAMASRRSASTAARMRKVAEALVRTHLRGNKSAGSAMGCRGSGPSPLRRFVGIAPDGKCAGSATSASGRSINRRCAGSGSGIVKAKALAPSHAARGELNRRSVAKAITGSRAASRSKRSSALGGWRDPSRGEAVTRKPRSCSKVWIWGGCSKRVIGSGSMVGA